MSRTIVFDVNETMLDMKPLAEHFERLFGERQVLEEWFATTLLHSEVATIAGPYFDFGSLGGAVLDMMAAARSQTIQARDKQQLLQALLHLPPHPEVEAALQQLKSAGLQLVTLGNAKQQALEQQMQNAGLSGYFARIFSVDAVQRFKPAPETYRMVAEDLGRNPSELRMVAAHAWDVLGAMRAGCHAAFVARPGKALFPLAEAPDIVGNDLLAVAEKILALEIK